jgi:lipase maturation factor
MKVSLKSAIAWLLAPEPRNAPGHLWARWIFLRALGLIFFSVFYSLLFQIQGMVGPGGILPAGEYLPAVAEHFGLARYWYAPTLLWFSSGAGALNWLCWLGLAASVLLFLNLWPRGMAAICFVFFLSFIAVAQDFADFQSDGMLLAAGFLCLFFGPRGFRPRLGESSPPSRVNTFLLLWLWFRIYFESGVVKLASHDPEWRHMTAMDQYYQNGPLPTWVGWYMQQLPHRIQAALTVFTLIAELALCWMMFLPRRFRILCFLILTPFQIGIILTANYCFLNYLVLALGFLLLDDRFFRSLRVRAAPLKSFALSLKEKIPFPGLRLLLASKPAGEVPEPRASYIGMAVSGLFFAWIFYATTALLLLMLFPPLPLPLEPVAALEPYRVANEYGLFAVMTTARYEIEFQGTRDGSTWTAYPFRYKPQDPREPPGIYAPYQPRFEWDLWFASLGPWRQYPWVVTTEELLLKNDPSVLQLFRSNPFPGEPPAAIRAVIWQYWFTDLKAKRETGLWWNRKLLGLYAPALVRDPSGKIGVLTWPNEQQPPPQP